MFLPLPYPHPLPSIAGPTPCAAAPPPRDGKQFRPSTACINIAYRNPVFLFHPRGTDNHCSARRQNCRASTETLHLLFDGKHRLHIGCVIARINALPAQISSAPPVRAVHRQGLRRILRQYPCANCAAPSKAIAAACGRRCHLWPATAWHSVRSMPRHAWRNRCVHRTASPVTAGASSGLHRRGPLTSTHAPSCFSYEAW